MPLKLGFMAGIMLTDTTRHTTISAAEMKNMARQPSCSPMKPLITREARMPVSSPLST